MSSVFEAFCLEQETVRKQLYLDTEPKLTFSNGSLIIFSHENFLIFVVLKEFWIPPHSRPISSFQMANYCCLR